MTTKAPTRIRYMGNKVALANDVARVVADIDLDRPLVDLFGGMCSIATAVSPTGRQVIVNDVQSYAQLVARCLIASVDGPPSPDKATAALLPGYRENRELLSQRFETELRAERRVLASADAATYRRKQETWRHAGNDPTIAAECATLREAPTLPYRLATLTFAWGYFGLRQSIDIDSVRCAIDKAERRRALTSDEAAWCRLSLLQTCSRISSSPGHFAQFLRGESLSSLKRIRASRQRSVWDSIFDDLAYLAPYGSRRWRSKNRVLGSDALQIWDSLDEHGIDRAVFYADPPYSKEQYSRFYHVLESLELYDYPMVTGIGRYRGERFVTPLGMRRGVVDATRSLCSQIAGRAGVLLLSYPSSGLLTAGLGVDIQALLEEYFASVTPVVSMKSRHSSLGGRHGVAERDVTEYVWLAA